MKNKNYNGNIVRALASSMETYKSISKRLVSPNLGDPPTYDQARVMQATAMTDHFNSFTKNARAKSKTIPINHPINGHRPPIYMTRTSDGQRTLDLSLSQIDTTSPINEIEHATQLQSKTLALYKRGINADGLPLKGGRTDTMFEQDGYFQQVSLSVLAVDFRRDKTIIWNIQK